MGNNKKSTLGRLRRAILDDAEEIRALLTKANVTLFHSESAYDIKQLIASCVLSICQLDGFDNVVGFAALTDHPKIPFLHPSAWEEYIWARYKTKDMTARNTLFIHLLCWLHESPMGTVKDSTAKHFARKAIAPKDILTNLLRSVFMHDCYVHYVCFVKPLPDSMPLEPGDTSLESMFKQVPPAQGVRGVPAGKLPALMMLARPDICPRLRIRRAVEEDNDDIVPIVDAQSTRLRELYGEFYVSELVARHPESNRVLLVAEHMEVAVGVMVLNTRINYDTLEDNFALAPLAGLRKPSAASLAQAAAAAAASAFLPPRSVESNVNISGEMMLDESAVSSFNVPDISKLRRKVSFSMEGLTTDAPRQSAGLSTRRSRLLSVPRRNLYYLALLEQDEELEFDIVNIERSLLHVPKTLSFDSFIYGADSEPSTLSDDSTDHTQESHEKRRTGALQSTSATRRDPDTPRRRIHSDGMPDAFVIELFAMHPLYDERHGFDLLEVAFEVFPDYSFAILALPTDHVAYPLLEHFTLVTPLPTRYKLVDQSLYAAHRNSVRGRVRVRPAEPFDVVAAIHLLDNAPRHTALLDQFAESLASVDTCSFMMLSENSPVGVITLGPQEDQEQVRSQYTVGVDGGADCNKCVSGVVLAAVLAPALEPHARWFLRELLRHTTYNELCWTSRLNGRGDAVPGRNLMSFTGHMVPTRPRRLVLNFADFSKDHDKAKVTLPIALWHINRPLTSQVKVDINHSIVVVGSSATALAFIETLLFGPSSAYLSFTNVTLVSTQGLPTVPECMRALSTFVVRTSRYDDRYLKIVPFHFYVDVLAGTMVKIDRKKKCIMMQSGGVKHYDDLYLMVGVQFQHPHYLRNELNRERQFEQGVPCKHETMDDAAYEASRLPLAPNLPDNVMLVNGIMTANKALLRLMCMLHGSCSVIKEKLNNLGEIPTTNRIVVYGDCINALSCIAALLEMALPPSSIAYVESFPPEDPRALRVQHFNNETVDSRVLAALKSTGVTLYRGYNFAGWSIDCNGCVESIKLLSRHHSFDLPCFAVFYFGERRIDLHAFCAINSCGLVYDGGLVVDSQFATNDPHIFGAGGSTRYSRRLHADRFLHKHYRSEDVGTALGEMVLNQLDPFRADVPGCSSKIDIDGNASQPSVPSTMFYSSSTLHSDSKPTSKESIIKPRSVLKFKSPIVCSCTLPGGRVYLHVRPPGPLLPAAAAACMDAQGHTLITDKDGQYFRLCLNRQHTVSELTCLSTAAFPVELFVQLYGKHEKLLGDLLLRHQTGHIEDLYAYFMSPWLTAVYRDDFQDLLSEIDHLSIISDGENVGTFRETVRDLVNKSGDPNLELGLQRTVNAAARLWETSGAGAAAERRLAVWLRARRRQLSLYSIPQPT